MAVLNRVSSELARQDLLARGIPLSSVALLLLRDISEPWMRECAVVLRYPGMPPSGPRGQWRFLGYYRSVARFLRGLDLEKIRDVYVVNNEGLITSHLLALAQSHPAVTATVVVEGLLNFQDRVVADRPAWRWLAKPVVARALGYDYQKPGGHLSGSFEPRVSRVLSFAAEGLKAPPEKVVLYKFQPLRPVRRGDPQVALVLLTNWTGWMSPADHEAFARAFVGWVRASGYRKIQVKKHPRTPGGFIEESLADCEEVGVGQVIEDMAADLEAGTVLGTCSTALVTLKFLRPDVRCIDFGSDFYGDHAYHGEGSPVPLLSAAGVEVVKMADSETDRRQNA